MVDFILMFENEDVREIVLFLSGRKKDGIPHPQLDGYCTTYGNNRISNIELISLVKDMPEKGELISNDKGGIKKARTGKPPHS